MISRGKKSSLTKRGELVWVFVANNSEMVRN